MTTYTIYKRFTFSASHQLHGLPPGHQCARMHGHNYAVTVELQGTELDGPGMLLDFAELAKVRAYIDDTLDHQHLNDILAGINPTAENLARHLLDLTTTWWPDLAHAVEVQETETSCARAQR